MSNSLDFSKPYFYACLLFVFGLLTQGFFAAPLTIGMIAIGLIWIFSFSYKNKFENLRREPFALSLIAFYSLHVLSLLQTDNIDVALVSLLLKTSIFLLPLFMMSTDFITRQQRIIVLRFFACLMMVMAFTDLLLSLLEFLKHSRIESFFYANLTHLLPYQPHYVSWYYLMALCISLHQLWMGKKWKILWGIGVILFLVSFILLSSRAYYLAFSLVFFVSLIKLFRKNLIPKSTIRYTLLTFILFVTAILFIPNTSKRITDAKNEVESMLGISSKYTNPRIYIWNHGMDLILKKPLSGYGMGDAKEQLNLSMTQTNSPFSGRSLNFHNQYLQSWAQVGIVGFLLLLYAVIGPLFTKNQHPLFLIFIGLTLVGLLTESMFERQSGVLFFAFMYPLLLGLRKDTDTTE